MNTSPTLKGDRQSPFLAVDSTEFRRIQAALPPDASRRMLIDTLERAYTGVLHEARALLHEKTEHRATCAMQKEPRRN